MPTRQPPHEQGVTLIELMIAVVLIAVLLAIAVPSFAEFRQRSIARGAADQLVSFWANARFEAVKRNALVKVGFVRDAVDGICLGAATTADPDDIVACDCFTPGACDIAQFPGDQSEWSGAQWLADPTFGGNSGVLVIEPKSGGLADPDQVGQVTVRSPDDARQYRLRMVIDAFGRAVLCEPADAPLKIPGFSGRTCG